MKLGKISIAKTAHRGKVSSSTKTGKGNLLSLCIVHVENTLLNHFMKNSYSKVSTFLLLLFFVKPSMVWAYFTLPFIGEYTPNYFFEDPKYRTHKGTDYPLPSGTSIVAAKEGIVIKAYNSDVYNVFGNHIIIDHGIIEEKRVKTLYAHLLKDSLAVVNGMKVLRGQLIEKSGNTGYSLGPHLHFEVTVEGKSVNPYDTDNYLWTKTPPDHSVYIPAQGLLLDKGGSTIYWRQNNNIYPVSDGDVISKMQAAGIKNWSWGLIVEVPDLSDLPEPGPKILTSTSESSNLLIRNDSTGEIFKVNSTGYRDYQPELPKEDFSNVINMASSFFGSETVPTHIAGEGAPTELIRQVFENAYKANAASLGLATNIVKKTSTVSGYYQTFNKGSIQYHSSGSLAGKAFAVVGSIYDKWSHMGYDRSVLGLPVSNRSAEITSSQGTKGFYQEFKEGSIQVNINNGVENAFAVYGVIYDKWGSSGYAAGELGLPIADRSDISYSGFGTEGYYQRFERGAIQVIGSDVYAVSGSMYDEWSMHGFAGTHEPSDLLDVGQTSWAGFPTSGTYSCYFGICQNFEGGYIQNNGTDSAFVSNTHPSSLTCTQQIDGNVLCGWKNNISANGVNIYRYGSPLELIAVLSPNQTSFIDTKRDQNHSYTYYIQAFNDTAESPPSNKVTVDGQFPWTLFLAAINAGKNVKSSPPPIVQTPSIPTVVSKTGRIWMDRNLGASRVATSPTDPAAYGDLYQWGRLADGHEKRTSLTTTTLSTSDAPGHNRFINSVLNPIYHSPDNPFDWRTPKNDSLWQGTAGKNNPCPSGFRLPTSTEWYEEVGTWSHPNATGAFDSPLKLVEAGYRNVIGEIRLDGVGSYWTSTTHYYTVDYFGFGDNYLIVIDDFRQLGSSVRCIKD